MRTRRKEGNCHECLLDARNACAPQERDYVDLFMNLFEKLEFFLKSLSSVLSVDMQKGCLLYTSPSPRDRTRSRMPSSA